MLQDKNSRIYAFDNIKFILIFLVVFGHFLEIAQGWGEEKEQVTIVLLDTISHWEDFSHSCRIL